MKVSIDKMKTGILYDLNFQNLNLKKIHMVLTGSANHFVRGGIPMPTSLKLKTLKTLKLKKNLQLKKDPDGLLDLPINLLKVEFHCLLV